MRMIDIVILDDPRTKKEIARLAKIRPQHLSAKLKGRLKFNEAEIRRLADVLGVSAKRLMSSISSKGLMKLLKIVEGDGDGDTIHEKHRQEPTESTGDPSLYSGVLPLPPHVPAPHLGDVPAGRPQEKDGSVPTFEPPRKKPKSRK